MSSALVAAKPGLVVAGHAGCELPMTAALVVGELRPPLPKQKALVLSVFALSGDLSRQTWQVALRSVLPVEVLPELELARPVDDAVLLMSSPLLQ